MINCPIAIFLCALLLHGSQDSPADEGASAAELILSAVDESQQQRLLLEFDSPERRRWNYLPGQRAGLALAQMTPAQRSQTHALLETSLSPSGMEMIEGLYAMERRLRQDSIDRGREDPSRDPNHYQLAIFGTPGSEPWAWRLEGHHLSLNITHVGDETSVTPLFIGVAPFAIKDGPDAGTNVLGTEKKIAFELLRSFSPDQRDIAVISDRVPGDVLLTPGKENRLSERAGLPLSEMNTVQQKLAMQLLEQYANRLRGDLAAAELKRIRDAGITNVYFAWAGSTEPDQPHYFRLHGPTFILEYDCVTNTHDHVHMVWHDPNRNFGADPLKEHLQKHHEPSTSAPIP